MSRKRNSNVFRVIHENRRLVGLRYGTIAVVAGLAVITGFGQAALLILIVRAATALTADTVEFSGQIGPIAATDLTVRQLILLGFGVIGVMLVAQVAAAYTASLLTVNATRRAQLRMLSLFSRATFDAQVARSRGETQYAVVGLPGRASGVVAGFVGLIVSVVNFVALTGSALVLSPVAGSIVIAGIVGLILALHPLNFVRRRLARRSVLVGKEQAGRVVGRFELAQEARSFGVDEAADVPIRQGIDDLTAIGLRLGFAGRMAGVGYQLGALVLILGMLALIDASDARNLAALTGALLILLRSLTYGQKAFKCYQALSESTPVVEQLAEEARHFRDSSERTEGTQVPSGHIGRVVFDSVGFSYVEGVPVLKDVSFTIEKGDFVALVGPTGAGKSTIMQLLLRLRTHDCGTISVDGWPMSEISLEWWRSRIGYVAQEPKILTGSVAEAIRFYRPGLSDEAVQEAARRAHIAEEIESWAHGFDAEVGQMGEGVSGGQRQRIALARALVGQPDLLLLDEPTSALDPRSEARIAQTLDELRGELTIVVIAHRYETVRRANKVVVIENGRILPHCDDDFGALRTFFAESQTA